MNNTVNDSPLSAAGRFGRLSYLGWNGLLVLVMMVLGIFCAIALPGFSPNIEQGMPMFAMLLLDNQHRLITHETLFKGTISHTEVHPREVVKASLKYNAAAVIVAHCHPSGHAEPSQADRRVTERLKNALDLVGVRLLDHLVIGGMDIVSFAERGWL